MFSLPIPNKHSIEDKKYDVIKRARIRFHVAYNIIIVIRDLEEKYLSFLVQDSTKLMKILLARVNPYSRINWCEKWTIV